MVIFCHFDILKKKKYGKKNIYSNEAMDINIQNFQSLNVTLENENTEHEKFLRSLFTTEELQKKIEELTPEDDTNKEKISKTDIIVNMMSKGFKVEEIAVKLDVSCKTIYRICENEICDGDKKKYKELLKQRRHLCKEKKN